MRGPDIGALLSRAVLADSGALAATLVENGWRSWASATFSGARHWLVLSLPAGAGAGAWLAALPEAEFAIRGHLVADIVVVAVEPHMGATLVTLEALTVEDG